MGLGGLLLNPGAAARRLRPPAPPVEEDVPAAPAAPAAARTAAPRTGATATRAQTAKPVSNAAVKAAEKKEDEEAEFVILWPALGCPGLVREEARKLELIFLAKNGRDTFFHENGNHDLSEIRRFFSKVQVLAWDEARKPYNQDGTPWCPTKTTTLDKLYRDWDDIRFTRLPQELEKYASEREDGAPVKFGQFLHNIAKVVPRVYMDEKYGFKSILGVELSLTDTSKLRAGSMYTLYYPPENGLLRKILEDDALLEKPFDDIPLMSHLGHDEIGGPNQVYRARGEDGSNEDRERRVRLFHPFRLLEKKHNEYLDVAHVTDPHTSTLWDYLDRLIFPEYPQDTPRVDDGKRDGQHAAVRFRSDKTKHIPRQFNNPNVNLRDLTQKLKNQVDVILQTGDLVDFNRGFNHHPDHRLDRDYVFNLNWIRYYELLLLDYERPTYTSLGNHDWRINPYPPYDKAEWPHYLLILALLCGPMSLAGMLSAVVLNLAEKPLKPYNFVFTSVFTTFLLVILFYWVLTPLIGPRLHKKIEFPWIYLASLGYSIVLSSIFALRFPEENIASWGFVIGGGIGFVLFFLPVFFYLWLWYTKGRMGSVTNLKDESDFKELLGEGEIHDVNLIGRDSSLYLDETSFDWYALVINPFLDYAFVNGNLSILMIDWGGQEIPHGSPHAADAFTDRQWHLIKEWLPRWAAERRRQLERQGGNGKLKSLVSILGLHAPVFCPQYDANLDALHTDGASVDDKVLKKGIMTQHRQDLVKLLYKLAHSAEPSIPRPCPVHSLAGHTHVYDVFRHKGADKVIWYQAPESWTFKGLDLGLLTGYEGLHITTAGAGPQTSGRGVPNHKQVKKEATRRERSGDKDFPRELREEVKSELERLELMRHNIWEGRDIGDYLKQGRRVARPAGCRVLRFDRDGKLIAIDELSSTTARWGGL